MLSPRISAAVLVILIATFTSAALAQTATLAPIDAPAPDDTRPTVLSMHYLLSPADRINAVAPASDGGLIVAGVTLKQAGAFDASRRSAGEGDAFVARFSPDGSRLLYFSYLGHTGLDEARALAVDRRGNAYVAGVTRSPNFPLVRPLQAACGSKSNQGCAGNAFVAKLNAAGKIVFATYLGGSGRDEANALAVDEAGNMFVLGVTTSADFPVENALQRTTNGNGDAFVAGIAADGSHLLFSTYLGGSDSDEAHSIALDAAGNIYLTGKTTSLDFPISGAWQPRCALGAHGGCLGAAFITKLSANGQTIEYSTYLGGSGENEGNAIAVDEQGNAYVAGATTSPDFPVENAVQALLKGHSSAFVSKTSPLGSELLFSTLLGGSGAEQARAVGLDRAGNVLVAGWTRSPDFPVRNAVQAVCAPGKTRQCSVDAFIAVLNSQGSQLRFSTYLGGSGADAVRAIAADNAGFIYLGGWTTSPDLPGAQTPQAPKGYRSPAGADLKHQAGGAFVAKFSGAPPPQQACKNWTGAAKNDLWSTPGNWAGGQVPTATDDVCINVTKTTIIIGNQNAPNQSIKSLTSSADLAFQADTFTITGTTNSSGNLSVQQGQLTFQGSASLNTLSMTAGTINGPGAITVKGMWTGIGTISQTTINANGGISCVGGTLSGALLSNVGTATCSGILNLMKGARVVNHKTWNLQNGSISTTAAAGGVFDNMGIVANLSGTSIVGAVFNNGASGASSNVLVKGGTLWFTGSGNCGGACAGTWTVSSGAVLQFGGGIAQPPYVLSGNIKGPGTTNILPDALMDFEGANTTVVISSPVNLNGGGILYGEATINVTAQLTWNGGKICAGYDLTAGNCTPPAKQAILNASGGIDLLTGTLDGRTLNNGGTVSTSQSSLLSLAGNAVVNNPTGKTWNMHGNARVNPSLSSSGVFNNNGGTLNSSSGTSPNSVSVPFQNTGTVNVTSGSFNLYGGGSCNNDYCNGTWTVSSDGFLSFYQGDFKMRGTISGAGLTVVNGASVAFSGGRGVSTKTNFDNGYIYGGNVVFSGPLTWSGGVMCNDYSLATGCSSQLTNVYTETLGNLNITGSVILNARVLRAEGATSHTVGSNLTLTNAQVSNGGTWDVSGGNIYVTPHSTGLFGNGGTLSKSSRTDIAQVQAEFLNAGKVKVSAGELLLLGGGYCFSQSGQGSIPCPGSWTVAPAGTTLSFGSGDFWISGNIAGAGETEINNAASLKFAAANAMTVAGDLNLNGGVMYGSAEVDVSGSLTFNGRMCTNFKPSSSPPACGPATSTSPEGKTVSKGFLYIYSATLDSRLLENRGTAEHISAGKLTLADDAAVVNEGVWSLSSGSINAGSNCKNCSFPNSGNFRGAGTVAVVLYNTGRVEPGKGIGIGNIALTNSGNGFNQSDLGTLVMDVEKTASATANDTLTISGTGTLDGTLEMNPIGTYQPTKGDSFTIATCAKGCTQSLKVTPAGWTVQVVNSNNVVATFTGP